MKSFWKNGILLILILAIFLAPFSVGIKKTNKKIEFKENISSAQNSDGAKINVEQYLGIGSTSASYIITLKEAVSNDNYGLYYGLYEKTWTGEEKPKDATPIKTKSLKVTKDVPSQAFNIDLNNLKPQTNYLLLISLNEIQSSLNIGEIMSLNWLNFVKQEIVSSSMSYVEFTTSLNDSYQGETTKIRGNTISSNDYGCSLGSPTSWFTNCVALFLYSVVYQPLAWLTKISAYILDFFVYYSTNDDSYRSTFVEKAWGAVRDVANIFFIITLLYIAIKTILGLNVTDNKRLIGAVVGVALIINFSLFTTKLVIDSSNILAKVFYNNITSVDKGSNNTVTGSEGEKSISVGLVKQFNPQNLLGGQVKDNLTEFFVLLILSIGLTVFMIYIFLSISLIFVARVVSLWLSMIFSPLAFVSYSVPFDIPGFGHKDWWKNLFQNAMLAPLFIFFLYIIILFGDFFSLVKYDVSTSSTDSIQFIMKTLIPFFVVFILLKQAKDLAVKYSGDMGKAIQGIGAALGTLAVGGAALTTAGLGRTLIGKPVALASKNEDAVHYAKAKLSFEDKMKDWRKNGGEKPSWEQHKKEYINKGGKDFKENAWTWFGAGINASQLKTGKVDHARHEMDEAKKAAGLEKVSDNNLSGVEKDRIRDEFIKSKRSEIEGDIIKGSNAKNEDIKLGTGEFDKDGKEIMAIGKNDYENKIRHKKTQEIINSPEEGDVEEVKTGTKKVKKINPNNGLIESVEEDVIEKRLSSQGRKKLDNIINISFNNALKEEVKKIGEKKFHHIDEESKEHTGILQRAASKTTSGSYDIRNIPNSVDKREWLGTKALVGLTSAVAAGIRTGMKTGLNTSSIGTPQGNFFKDLSNTVTEALKSAKFDIKLGEGGGGGHGGGHDAGHGGSHGGGGHVKASGHGHGGGHGSAHH